MGVVGGGGGLRAGRRLCRLLRAVPRVRASRLDRAQQPGVHRRLARALGALLVTRQRRRSPRRHRPAQGQ